MPSETMHTSRRLGITMLPRHRCAIAAINWKEIDERRMYNKREKSPKFLLRNKETIEESAKKNVVHHLSVSYALFYPPSFLSPCFLSFLTSFLFLLLYISLKVPLMNDRAESIVRRKCNYRKADVNGVVAAPFIRVFAHYTWLLS